LTQATQEKYAAAASDATAEKRVADWGGGMSASCKQRVRWREQWMAA